MSVRVRHCVECPKCRIRYLMGFSPYRNGSSLVPSASGTSDAWVLYCCCQNPQASSLWAWEEIRRYAVATAAYRRRYGSADEITALADDDRVSPSLLQSMEPV